MKILGIETSCDETGAAIIENGTKLFANVVVSSLTLHAKTGGIIPEIAARAQQRFILPVIEQSLKESHASSSDIDAIAVTVGPGLIGPLLVGVETARTLAYIWNKPIVPVNHLIGHIYANFIRELSTLTPPAYRHLSTQEPKFPAIALIVSGGHTDLVLLKEHGNIQWLGGTRDDAAGEAFDKIGRLLNLPYPGGPAIEKASERGDATRFAFPRPMIDSDDFDFSFSGLKTAVLREVRAIRQLNDETIADLAASVQQAVIDVLVTKTIRATEKFNARSIVLSGGVAANQALRDQFELNAAIFAPQKFLCTDNAAMIAAAAFYNYKEIPWQKIRADPELYFD